MRLVIKVAGALLEGEESTRSVARQIAFLGKSGHEVLAIHGGGKIFTSVLATMGISSRFVAGLRVTDAQTRDAAVMVFAGLLNQRLTAAISLAGQKALGICASDAVCFRAEPLVHAGQSGGLGYVGCLTSVNLDFLESLWRAGMLLVGCCLGLGPDGQLYNINADHMAAACAEYCGADRLIFLTDVAGVCDGKRVLPSLDSSEIEDLIRRQKISGGMLLKLEASKRALNGGVRHVRIVGGLQAGALLLATQGRRGTGTRVLPPRSSRRKQAVAR